MFGFFLLGSPMLRLRRLTALVVNVLLIQVNLAGYGRTCVQGGNSASQATNMATMAHAPNVPGEAESARDDCAAEQACPHPWIPASVIVTSADTPARDPVRAGTALMWQGPPSAPDLPPPRA